MTRLRHMALLLGMVLGVSLGVTTTTASAAYCTYDVRAIALVGAVETEVAEAGPTQLGVAHEEPVSPSAEAPGASTTPPDSRNATEAESTVNLSTAGRSAEEPAAINHYASRSNAWLAENGP
jgi:hypothetical protein